MDITAAFLFLKCC